MFIWHLLESRYRIQRTPFCVFFFVHLLQELASLSLLSLDSVTVKNLRAPWSLQWRNPCPYLRSLSSSSAMYFRAFSFTLISAKQKPKVAAIVLKDWIKPRSTQLKAPNQNRSQADSKDHILGWESTRIRQVAAWSELLGTPWGLQSLCGSQNHPCAVLSKAAHWMSAMDVAVLCASHLSHLAAKNLVEENEKKDQNGKQLPFCGWTRRSSPVGGGDCRPFHWDTRGNVNRTGPASVELTSMARLPKLGGQQPLEINSEPRNHQMLED